MREEHQAELKKVEDTIFVDKKEMKVIKGLEDRLSGLEKLMVNVKKIVKEQEDMAKVRFSAQLWLKFKFMIKV